MEAQDYSSVPEALKARPQWVLWKLEERDGKQTKVPYDPKTFKHALPTDSSTWSSFEHAQGVLEHTGDRYNGLGFMFAEDRAITGIDLDHVLHEGKLDPEFQRLVDRADTYCEVSPSGTGVHLFLLGAKPDGFRRCRATLDNIGPDGKNQGVEVYDHDRFFTVTGIPLDVPKPMKSDPGLLTKINDKFFAKQNNLAQTQPMQQMPPATPRSIAQALSDQELVERMLKSKNGGKIQRLLDGDTSDYGEDDSAADMALCDHLAFWTNCDAEQMDRIFRTSKLMRPKWDALRGDKTYGEITIETAIASCGDTYDPSYCSAMSSVDEISSWVPSIILPFPWSIEGVFLYKETDSRKTLITNTPPVIVQDLIDIESNVLFERVMLPIKGELVEQVVPREFVFDKNKLKTFFTSLGATFSDSNAKFVVDFLTACEYFNSDNRPTGSCVSHLGWVGKDLRSFKPYDDESAVYLYTADQVNKSLADSLVQPKGSLDAWASQLAPIREESHALRALLAAGFASVLVEPFGIQGFTLYIWGPSRSGKTPSLKAAASIWGNPEGEVPFMRTFNDTPKSLLKRAEFLHNLPMCIDELQSKRAIGGQKGRRESVEIQMYALSNGVGQGGLNPDRTQMQSGTWRLVCIATGEIPLIGNNTMQGAANRILELHAKPFETEKDARKLHAIVGSNYGVAGSYFIKVLMGIDLKELKDQWHDFLSKFEDNFAASPQALNICFLCFTDMLVSQIIFGIPEQTAFESAMAMGQWILAHTKSFEDSNTELKGIHSIHSFLDRFDDLFPRKVDPYFHGDKLFGFKGELQGHSCTAIYPEVLREHLEPDFDVEQILSRMKQEGLLITNKTGYQKDLNRENWGGRGRFYVIKTKDLARYLFSDNNESFTDDTGVDTYV